MTVDCNLLINSLIRDCKKRLAMPTLVMVIFKSSLMKVICCKSVFQEEKNKLSMQLDIIKKDLKPYIQNIVRHMIEIDDYLFEKGLKSKYFDKTYRKLISLQKKMIKVVHMLDSVSKKNVI